MKLFLTLILTVPVLFNLPYFTPLNSQETVPETEVAEESEEETETPTTQETTRQTILARVRTVSQRGFVNKLFQGTVLRAASFSTIPDNLLNLLNEYVKELEESSLPQYANLAEWPDKDLRSPDAWNKEITDLRNTAVRLSPSSELVWNFGKLGTWIIMKKIYEHAASLSLKEPSLKQLTQDKNMVRWLNTQGLSLTSQEIAKHWTSIWKERELGKSQDNASTPEDYEQLVQDYYKVGRLDKVVEIGTKGIKRYPQTINLYIRLGNIYWDKGEYWRVIDLYLACLEKNPDAANVRRELALRYELLINKAGMLAAGKWKNAAVKTWTQLLNTPYAQEAKSHLQLLTGKIK